MMRRYIGENRQRVKPSANKWLIFWICLFIMSLFVLRPISMNVKTYSGIIESIDERKDTVTGLVAASALVSTGISLIPDDTATPIATQIAEAADYLMIVLGVLYLEKYLLPILGGLSTVLLIPVGCIMSIIYIKGTRAQKLKEVIDRVLIAAVAVVFVIPISVGVTNLIEAVYQESITNSINQVMIIEEEIEGESAAERNFWEQLTDAAGKAISGVTHTVEWAKNAMSRFVEAIVMLIIVNCVIPVMTAVAFLWIVKMLMKNSI